MMSCSFAEGGAGTGWVLCHAQLLGTPKRVLGTPRSQRAKRATTEQKRGGRVPESRDSTYERLHISQTENCTHYKLKAVHWRSKILVLCTANNGDMEGGKGWGSSQRTKRTIQNDPPVPFWAKPLSWTLMGKDLMGALGVCWLSPYGPT